MALKLVTAPPGTGKTLLLIDMIFEYLKQGRRVYANIDQLQIAEVLPFPANGDWRDFPDGSVIVIDEAQEHYSFASDDQTNFDEFEEPDQLEHEPVTKYKERVARLKRQYLADIKRKKLQIRDIASGLQIHRHFGFDIILATQASTLLNQRTRDIVGEHYHLIRPFGAKVNTLYFWRKCVDNPDSRENQKFAEWKKTKRFNKNYFHLYHSANVHTHKTTIPASYFVVAILTLCLFIIPFYLLKNSNAAKQMAGIDTQASDIVINQEKPKDLTNFKPPSPTATQLPDQKTEDTRIAMISESSSYCRAFTGTGDLIDIDESLCRKLSSSPRMLRASTIQKEQLQPQLSPDSINNSPAVTQNPINSGSVTYKPTNLSSS